MALSPFYVGIVTTTGWLYSLFSPIKLCLRGPYFFLQRTSEVTPFLTRNRGGNMVPPVARPRFCRLLGPGSAGSPARNLIFPSERSSGSGSPAPSGPRPLPGSAGCSGYLGLPGPGSLVSCGSLVPWFFSSLVPWFLGSLCEWVNFNCHHHCHHRHRHHRRNEAAKKGNQKRAI